jgi:hypothetical protein
MEFLEQLSKLSAHQQCMPYSWLINVVLALIHYKSQVFSWVSLSSL